MSEPRRRRRPQMIEQIQNDPIENENLSVEIDIEEMRKAEVRKEREDGENTWIIEKQSSQTFAQNKKKKRFFVAAIFVAVLILVILIAAFVYQSTGMTYRRAQRYLSKGEYHKAAETFERLGSYEDSTKLSMYCKAVLLADEGRYEEANAVLAALGDYKDCGMRMIYYSARNREMQASETDYKTLEEAIAIYKTVLGFLDSSERIVTLNNRIEEVKKALYDAAVDYAEKGNYEDADLIFEGLGDYADCAMRREYYFLRMQEEEVNNQDGILYVRYQYLTIMPDYLDSKERADNLQKAADAEIQAKYNRIIECLNEGNPYAAIENLKNFGLNGRENVDKYYLLAAQALTSMGAYDDAGEVLDTLKVKNEAGVLKGITESELIEAVRILSIARADNQLLLGEYEKALEIYREWEHEAGIKESVYQAAVAIMESDPVSAYKEFLELGVYKDSSIMAEKLYAKRFDRIGELDDNGLRIYGAKQDQRSPMLYGLLNEAYDVVLEAQYLGIKQLNGYTDLYILTRNTLPNEYTLANADGSVIGDAQYDNVQIGSDDGRFLKVQKNGLWGFINAHTGDVVVDTEWKAVQKMFDGYAYVRNNLDKWGVIDERGNVVVVPEHVYYGFEYCADIGYALLSDGAILNHKGEQVYTLRSRDTVYLGDGIFANDQTDNTKLYDVAEGKSYSFVVDGNTVEKLHKVGKNLISGGVFNGNRWSRSWIAYYAVLDGETGEILTNTQWSSEILYIPGPAKKDNKYGWISADGRDLLDAQWDYMCDKLICGCIVAGKYNLQGNIVYSVLSGANGSLIKDGFESLSEANAFCEEAGTYNENIYASAMEAFEQGNYAEAIKGFAGIVDLHGNARLMLGNAYYEQANAYLKEMDYENAAVAFKNAGNFADAAIRAGEPYYLLAEELISEGKYEEASAAFVSAGEYKDAKERAGEPYYLLAEELISEGKYEEASAAFVSAGEYKDASERIDALGKMLLTQGKEKEAKSVFKTADEKNYEGRLKYYQAELLLEKAEYWEAFYTFRHAAYKDSLKRAYEVGYKYCAIGKIDASYYVSIGLKDDGTVLVTGWNNGGLLNVHEWRDIVAVATSHIVPYGLKKDGTVITTDKDQGVASVNHWRNIIAISAGSSHIVGLKSDGTVLAAYNGTVWDGWDTYSHLLDVGNWKNIVAVYAGEDCTIGLKADGTIVCTDPTKNYSAFSKVIDVASGNREAVLMHDGLLKYLSDTKPQEKVQQVLDVDVYENTEIALKANGTVYACSNEKTATTRLRNKVKEWKDIVAVAAGAQHVLGLKKDGTVLAAAYTTKFEFDGEIITIQINEGQTKVGGWDLWN